jgi:hypothetical protein
VGPAQLRISRFGGFRASGNAAKVYSQASAGWLCAIRFDTIVDGEPWVERMHPNASARGSPHSSH